MTERNAKIRVCLLFGGKSEEHEVSLQSAKSICEALDKEKYDVVLVGITKQGQWLLGDASTYLLNAQDPRLIALNARSAEPVAVRSEGGAQALIVSESGTPRGSVDVVFPVIHGPYGEDGRLQGLLDMIGVPYVGSGVLGSAIGMDKDVMKRLLRDAGVPVGRFFVARRRDGTSEALRRFVAEIGYPVFVKPANLGSSVGVSKAHDDSEVGAALAEAFRYDEKALVEEFIHGRELEVSVLDGEPPRASVPGEVMTQGGHEFYSYDAKYIDENGAALVIPAEVPEEVVRRIQDAAISAFRALEARDFARVDCFLTSEGKILVNEINTIPGFTKISMYPKLWEASGLPYRELLDKLIGLALARAGR